MPVCTFTYFGTVSCISAWPQSCYVAKDDLKLLILPALPPEGGGSRYIFTMLEFYTVLGMEFGASGMLKQVLYKLSYITRSTSYYLWLAFYMLYSSHCLIIFGYLLNFRIKHL